MPNRSEILFSTPTIANDAAPLEPITGRPTPADFVLDEDEWRQTEIFPRHRLEELQRTLTELKAFEAANRHGPGWRRIFVRRLPDALVVSGTNAPDVLANALDVRVQPGPLVTSSGSVVGRVANGFSLRTADGVTLYGYRGAGGIPVLGVLVEPQDDNAAVFRVFARLRALHEIVLVDWTSLAILMDVDERGAAVVWQP